MDFSAAGDAFETALGPHDAVKFLRSHSKGLLLVDGEARAREYICDPATGAPVTGADAWMLDGGEHVFCAPDDGERSLQLLVSPRVIEPRTHAAGDRYRAYHGEIAAARLVLWEIESGKGAGKVWEGDELHGGALPPRVEGALIRELNSRHEAFATATQKALQKVWADPRAVGVDSWGVDIKSRFGMTRIQFSESVTEETAAAAIAELLKSGEV